MASGVVASCAAALVSGCIQSHEGLAARDGAGGASSSRGGAGGGWQPPTDGSVSGEASPEGGAGGSPFVPDGPRTLTLLHGVTDSPWLAFCFSRVDAGTEAPASGSPLPAGGLEFGASATVSSLPSIDLATDAIRPYAVLAANADAVSGLACTTIVALSRIPPLRASPPPPIVEAGRVVDASSRADASMEGGSGSSHDGSRAGDAAVAGEAGRDAAPPPLATDASPPIPGVRVAALPVIPGGQLALERSYLLVPSGCFGGPGVTDPSEHSICGDSYSPDTPTLAPIIVALPRAVPAGKVGISFLNATPAFSFCDVRLVPGGGGDPLTVAVGVTTGALRPLSPVTKWSSSDVAPLGDKARVRVFPNGAKDVPYDEPWTTTFAASSVPVLTDGSAYTLVLIGPYPTFTKGRFWNAPLVTLVKN